MRRVLLFIVLIALVGGGVWYFYFRPKETSDGSTESNGIGDFFPLGDILGGSDTETPTGAGGEASAPGAPIAAPDQPFKRIAGQPVAGYVAFTTSRTLSVESTEPGQKPSKETIVEHVVRYVSRANGYVHEVVADGIPVQISNIFIPNIYEAAFTADGKTAVLRFLRDDSQTIATYSVPVPDPNPDGTRTQQQGSNFADDISSVAISPDMKQVAQVSATATNGILSTTDLKGGARKELLRNPFSEWLVSWPLQKTIYLQTKASAAAEGFLYKVDTTEKRLRRVIGDIPGLTASISPQGTYILYSESAGNGFTTKLFNTKTNTTRALDAAILPEKCVWLKNEDALCAGNETVPQASYPDAWYQGLVTFSDKFYRVYMSAGIMDAIDSGIPHSDFDAISPSVDEAAGTLYFINKRDGFLWRFKY